MHHRLPVWLFLFAFVVSAVSRAQTPAAAPADPLPSQAGEIKAAKVTGSVSVKVADQTRDLHNGDSVEQNATVITALNSSVVLVFSNGATTQLGADTVMTVEQFLQDPFAQDQKVADMQEEPTRSTTKLNLTKGELVGKVVHLKHDKGSTFTVQTPVGAAGIRGTTFRIVFRPQGTGLAFFALSTVEGNVNFTQPGQNNGNNAGANGNGNGNANGNGNGNGGNGNGGNGNGGNGNGGGGGNGNSGGVSVAQGQEVVVTVTVNTTPSGAVVVTTAPTVTASVPISAATQAAVTQVAVQIATAAATVTFTPTPPAPPPPTPPSGNGNNANNSNSNNNNSNNNSNNNNSNSNNNQTPPPVTNQVPRVTSGDGR
jgi:hypothetical protein